jgi:hypothetical protein
MAPKKNGDVIKIHLHARTKINLSKKVKKPYQAINAFDPNTKLSKKAYHK